MKRLLAFGASSLVAGLLLMRLLPEFAAGHEDKAEPEMSRMQIEQIAVVAPAEEMPDSARALLLPPPPERPQPEAEQVTAAPEPIAEVKTPPSKSAPQAPPEIVQPVEAEMAAEEATEPVEVAAIAVTQSKPAAKITLAKETIVEAAPTPRPATKPNTARAQITAALSKPIKAERDPSPSAGKAARSPVNSVEPDPVVEAEGRVLLRILEHGSGPEIEIAWPVSAIKRRALYRLFEACYGMEIALLDSGGRLFGQAGQAGRPWQPNLDRYSGFVRQPSGRLTMDEKDGVARIRAFHGGLRAANNVRLFPRRLDALLLGGLKALIGDGYGAAAAIRAHYRRDGNSVLVEGIRLDGQPVLGRIDLSKAGKRCRARAWS